MLHPTPYPRALLGSGLAWCVATVLACAGGPENRAPTPPVPPPAPPAPVLASRLPDLVGACPSVFSADGTVKTTVDDGSPGPIEGAWTATADTLQIAAVRTDARKLRAYTLSLTDAA